jgi:hypothetical protein
VPKRTKFPDGRPSAPVAEATETTEPTGRPPPRATQDYRPSIPTIPTPAEKLAAIREAAQRKHHKAKPCQPEEN